MLFNRDAPLRSVVSSDVDACILAVLRALHLGRVTLQERIVTDALQINRLPSPSCAYTPDGCPGWVKFKPGATVRNVVQSVLNDRTCWRHESEGMQHHAARVLAIDTELTLDGGM